jgi:hypothetical protein
MWWVIVPLAALWVTGWISSIRHTDNTAKTWWGKLFVWLMLFFIWPYIAWAMIRQGDV